MRRQLVRFAARVFRRGLDLGARFKGVAKLRKPDAYLDE